MRLVFFITAIIVLIINIKAHLKRKNQSGLIIDVIGVLMLLAFYIIGTKPYFIAFIIYAITTVYRDMRYKL